MPLLHLLDNHIEEFEYEFSQFVKKTAVFQVLEGTEVKNNDEFVLPLLQTIERLNNNLEAIKFIISVKHTKRSSKINGQPDCRGD